MSLAFDRQLASAGVQREQPVQDASYGLNITVVFTTVQATMEALKKAGALASHLGARIALIVVQIVPYPLPLTSPPVLLEFNERRFSLIASKSSVETRVRLYLCRDRLETLARVLPPHSLVVLGSRRRWWPTAEKKIARQLRREGHEVLIVETE